MLDKEARQTLRMRFKQAVHQKPPVDAFRLAIMASNTLRSAGVPADEALTEAGLWLSIHAKGPSLQEWKELSLEHRGLLGSSTMAEEEQLYLFQYTHFMVMALSKWRRHLKRLPALYDVVLGATIPILAQTQAVPVSMKLLLIEKVEEALSRQNKSPEERCRLAELRLMRSRILLGSDDPGAQSEGLELLVEQQEAFAKLANQGAKKAAALHTKATELREEYSA